MHAPGAAGTHELLHDEDLQKVLDVMRAVIAARQPPSRRRRDIATSLNSYAMIFAHDLDREDRIYIGELVLTLAKEIVLENA
jgi:hypothetical protein